MIANYVSWWCRTVFSADWESWTVLIGSEFHLNVPLSIVLTVHTVLLSCLVMWAFDRLLSRGRRAVWSLGYEAGYRDGNRNRAIKLGQILFGKCPQHVNGCILWQPPWCSGREGRGCETCPARASDADRLEQGKVASV